MLNNLLEEVRTLKQSVPTVQKTILNPELPYTLTDADFTSGSGIHIISDKSGIIHVPKITTADGGDSPYITVTATDDIELSLLFDPEATIIGIRSAQSITSPSIGSSITLKAISGSYLIVSWFPDP